MSFEFGQVLVQFGQEPVYFGQKLVYLDRFLVCPYCLSPTTDSLNPSLLTLPLQKEYPTNENELHDPVTAYPPDEKAEQHQDTNQL